MTISIDFDGVIHNYSRGWHNGEIYDKPIPGAARFIYDCMYSKDWCVVIFSTREGQQIEKWMREVLFGNKELPFKISVNTKELKFWNTKKHILISNIKIASQVYLDDRGICFKGSFVGMIEEISNFKTWLEK